MAAKKVASPRSSPTASGGPAAPLWNAGLILGAVSYAGWLLVSRGRLDWPPHDLLAGAYTLAGCLALAGPVILARREEADGGVGEFAWMTGGLLIWVHDLVALARGDYRSVSWPTPIAAPTLGLTILAVLIAGWRLGRTSRGWTWTNVVGWVLGLFWVGMGLASLVPAGSGGFAAR